MKKNVLILGKNSFVAKGLEDILRSHQYEVDCFSRGLERRDDKNVFGNVYELSKNKYLKESYDIIINFILIKDSSIKENIKFIDSLISFSKNRRIKHIIHFSSIMVYDNNQEYIDEYTPIEKDTKKKGYGEIKIEVDKYLLSLQNLPFTITFIRPGYVLADSRSYPFLKKLPFGLSIIKGDMESIQPIVSRSDIHKALVNIIHQDCFKPVFLFTSSKNLTKYQYAKQDGEKNIIPLPRQIVLGAAKLLMSIGVIKPALFVRVEGMYIRSIYNSSVTQKLLNIKF